MRLVLLICAWMLCAVTCFVVFANAYMVGYRFGEIDGAIQERLTEATYTFVPTGSAAPLLLESTSGVKP